MTDQIRYVSLLRGINVGGKNSIPMDKLQDMFSRLGFTSVKTILNSGNVCFTTKKTQLHILKELIEASILETFHSKINTFICQQSDMQKLIATKPFSSYELIATTRFYVTFLSENATDSAHKTKIPTTSFIECVSFFKNSICWKLELSNNNNTTDAMKVLENALGKNITTRNWNTVLKIATL